MDLATLIFWIVAVILVGSALLVVGLNNIVHSALALIVVFAMAAGQDENAQKCELAHGASDVGVLRVRGNA